MRPALCSMMLACTFAASACSKKKSSGDSGSDDSGAVSAVGGGSAPISTAGHTATAIGTATPAALGAFSISSLTDPQSTATPTVAWTASDNATNYTVAVSASSSCSSPLQSFAAVAGTSQALNALVDGVYYACVTANGAGGSTLAATNNGLRFAVAAAFALGQPDIVSDQGMRSGLWNPGAVASDGTHLIVADTGNSRVLVYNAYPTANSAIPDVVVGAADLTENDSSYANLAGPSASSLSSPGGVSYDGHHLVVADTRNNRVLIWNSLPTTNDKAADVVIGQASFTSNADGIGATGLSGPQGVFSDGTRLFVADTNNNRLLIWTSFPTVSGQAASLVLGQGGGGSAMSGTAAADTAAGLSSPEAVYCDGTKLFVADAANNRVVVWNTVPSANGTAADFALGQASLTSNAVANPATATSLYHPTAVTGDGTQLYVSDTYANRVLVWSAVPTTSGAAASEVLGQSNPTSSGFATLSGASLYSPMGIYADTSQVVVADSGADRVLIYNSLPLSSGQAAGLVVGQTTVNSTLRNFNSATGMTAATLDLPFRVCGDGTTLAVTDYGESRVLLWKTLPTEGDQPADLVIGQTGFTGSWGQATSATSVSGAQGACPVGSGLAVADTHSNRVLIWPSYPTTNDQAASVVLGQANLTGNTVGATAATSLNQPNQVFSDGTKFYVVDTFNNRVLIWNEIPTTNQQPADVVVGQSSMSGNGAATTATGLSAPGGAWVAGDKLFVADTGNDRVLIWNAVPTSNGTAANVVIGQSTMTATGIGATATTMFSPFGVYSDGTKLYVADEGNNRVLVWNSVPAANGQAADAVIGQPSLTASQANGGGISSQSLNEPFGVFGDGHNLYISDTVNDRVLVLSLVQ